MPDVPVVTSGEEISPEAARFAVFKPVCRLRQTTAQSIPHNTDTPLTFTTEDFDTDPDGTGGHSTSSNTSRYTARYPGWYMCGGTVAFAANATSFRGTSWRVNGSTLNGSRTYGPNNGTGTLAMPARSMLIRLLAGDYLELAAFQFSGGSLNTAVTSLAEYVSSMDITWDRHI